MPVPVFRVYPPAPPTYTVIMLVDLGGNAEDDPEAFLIDNINLTTTDRELLNGVSALREEEELQFLFLRLNHDDLWESSLVGFERLLGIWKPKAMTMEELEAFPEGVTRFYYVRYHRKEQSHWTE